ncbi:hypothetical protein JCM10049v2_007699 [Rhodotorula toruloides]
MAEQTVRTLRQAVPPTILLSPMSQLDGAIQLAIIQLLKPLCPLCPQRAQLKQNELGASQHAARVRDASFALFDLLYVVTDGEAQWAGVGSDSSVDIGNWTFWKPFYPFGLYCPVLQMAQEPTLKLNDAACPAALSPTPSLAKLMHALSSATNKTAALYDSEEAIITFFVHAFHSPTRSSRPPRFVAPPSLANMPFIAEAQAAHYTVTMTPAMPHTHPDCLLAIFSSLVHSPERQQLHLREAIMDEPDLHSLFVALVSAGLTTKLDPAFAPFQLRTGQPIPPHLTLSKPADPAEVSAQDHPVDVEDEEKSSRPASKIGLTTSGTPEEDGGGAGGGLAQDVEGGRAAEGVQNGTEERGICGTTAEAPEAEEPVEDGEAWELISDNGGSVEGGDDHLSSPSTGRSVCDAPVSPASLFFRLSKLVAVDVVGMSDGGYMEGRHKNCTPLPFVALDKNPETIDLGSSTSTATLFLERRLSSSYNYDTFQARLSFEQSTLAVVCKFDRRGSDESLLEWEAQKWREVEERAGVDAVVPPLVGYFERAEKVNEVGGLLVTLRHGQRVEDLQALSLEQRQRIYTLYERLLATGLVHGQSTTRHILQDQRIDQFRLCDLEQSERSCCTGYELVAIAHWLNLPRSAPT